MALITEIETHESEEHKKAKIKLFNILGENRFTFINQYGKEFNITPQRTWDDLYMEAYVYKHGENDDPYKDLFMCTGCFNETDEFKDKLIDKKKPSSEEYKVAIDYCMENRFDISELNNIKKENNTFIQHPCSICKYKGKQDCILIFDIAGCLESKYTIAIEIVKTNRCSENKIKYCKENNIFLFEINYQDILNLQENDFRINCISMWWYEKTLNNMCRKCSYVY